MMVPASEDVIIKSGVLSFVGVGIILPEILGGVTSLLSVEVKLSVVLSSSEVLVVEDELSVDADEPPSSLPHEIMVRLKRSTNKMCKILLIFSLHQ